MTNIKLYSKEEERSTLYFTPLRLLDNDFLKSILREDVIPNVSKFFLKSEAEEKDFTKLSVNIQYGTKNDTKTELHDFAKIDPSFSRFNFICHFSIDNTRRLVFHAIDDSSIKASLTRAGREANSFNKEKAENYVNFVDERFKESFFSILRYAPLKRFLAADLFSEMKLKSDESDKLQQALVTKLLVSTSKKTEEENIKEIKGEYIPYFYNYKNYASAGFGDYNTIGNSCMRNNHNYFQVSFYAYNPQTVSLLVLFDDKENTKIRARCLLWKSLSGKIYADRIYYISDKDRLKMVDYLSLKGYPSAYGRETQTSLIMTYEEKEKEVFSISNESIAFMNGTPYFDSMCAMDIVLKVMAFSQKAVARYKESNKKSSEKLLFDIIEESNGKTRFKRTTSLSLIEWPFLSYGRSEDITSVMTKNGIKKSSIIVLKRMKERFNNLRSVLVYEEGEWKKQISDKKDSIWSSLINSYIFAESSEWCDKTNSFVPKNFIGTYDHLKMIKERAIKRIYVGKTVSISKEGIEWLNHINSLFISPISLKKYRPSRKFFITKDTVALEGIKIFNFIIPFRYLKIIKRDGKHKK